MLITLLGIEMPVMMQQRSNALSPILVNWLFSPNVMLVRSSHPANAPFPILVTLSGIVMLIRLLQTENAWLPMLVTPSLISTDLMLERYSYHGMLRLG